MGRAGMWEMGDAVRGLTERVVAAGEPVHGPALFVCRHHVFGVGTFAVDAVLAGDALVRAAGESGSAAGGLVGTISSCHRALNLLRIGAATGGTGRRYAFPCRPCRLLPPHAPADSPRPPSARHPPP